MAEALTREFFNEFFICIEDVMKFLMCIHHAPNIGLLLKHLEHNNPTLITTITLLANDMPLESPERMDEYTKCCEVITDLLTTKYPDNEFRLNYNEVDKKYEIIVDNDQCLVIRHDNNIKEIEKRLHKLFNPQMKRECCICLKKSKYCFACEKCDTDICHDDYYKLLKEHGIFDCPICRAVIDVRRFNETTDECLVRIKEKIKTNKKRLIVRKVK